MVTDIRAGEYLSPDEAEIILSLTHKCRLTRLGLDSYGFGLVAAGHLDLVVEAKLSWYDIAAVIPVIEAAGGVAMDWAGQPLREGFVGGRCIVAATRDLADAARAYLSQI